LTADLVWPMQLDRVAEQVTEFLAPNLRHHRSMDFGAKWRSAHNWAVQAHNILSKWTTSKENADERIALDEIRNAFNQATPTFAAIVESAKYRIDKEGQDTQ